VIVAGRSQQSGLYTHPVEVKQVLVLVWVVAEERVGRRRDVLVEGSSPHQRPPAAPGDLLIEGGMFSMSAPRRRLCSIGGIAHDDRLLLSMVWVTPRDAGRLFDPHAERGGIRVCLPIPPARAI